MNIIGRTHCAGQENSENQSVVEVNQSIGLVLLEWLALSSVADCRCPRGKSKRQRNKDNPRVVRIIRTRCKSWACDVCRDIQAQFRGMHYATKFKELAGEALFMGWLYADQWGSSLRQLNRKKASWVRLKPGRLIGTCQLPGMIPVSLEDAVRELGVAMRGLAIHHCNEDGNNGAGKKVRNEPISSSQSWVLPDRKVSEWRDEGDVDEHSPNAILASLAAKGILSHVIRNERDATKPEWCVTYQEPAQG